MFITFEGIDFCGKSTQIKMLKEYLISLGKDVVIIREPGGTVVSEKVREILLDKKNSSMVFETEFLLFSSSRAQLVQEKIRPFLAKGVYVISDRFHDSSTAYQGYGRGLPIDSIQSIHKIAIGETIPDITFLIDIPVEIANSRRTDKRGELDRIELSDINFYERVRNGYLRIADSESRFRVINGDQEVEKIHLQIIDEIKMIESTKLK